MPSFIKPQTIKRARRLRRNMTDGERKLWSEQGYRILRFNTGEISDSFDGCVEEILVRLV
jgi:very-short-patch-repair endonuclease